MANFQAIYNARYNQGGSALGERIQAAVAYVAQYILIEDAQTANHTNRLAWAKNVLIQGNLVTMASAIHWTVVANATIAAALAAGEPVADSDIEYVISSACHLWAPGA
jgi:hypothetical protein